MVTAAAPTGTVVTASIAIKSDAAADPAAIVVVNALPVPVNVLAKIAADVSLIVAVITPAPFAVSIVASCAAVKVPESTVAAQLSAFVMSDAEVVANAIMSVSLPVTNVTFAEPTDTVVLASKAIRTEATPVGSATTIV